MKKIYTIQFRNCPKYCDMFWAFSNQENLQSSLPEIAKNLKASIDGFQWNSNVEEELKYLEDCGVAFLSYSYYGVKKRLYKTITLRASIVDDTEMHNLLQIV